MEHDLAERELAVVLIFGFSKQSRPPPPPPPPSNCCAHCIQHQRRASGSYVVTIRSDFSIKLIRKEAIEKNCSDEQPVPELKTSSPDIKEKRQRERERTREQEKLAD